MATRMYRAIALTLLVLSMIALPSARSADLPEEELKSLREKYDVVIPVAHGIDFNDVRISVRVYRGENWSFEESGALEKYLLDRLSSAKVSYNPAQGDRVRTSALLWEVRSIPLEECPNRALYTNTIRLIEPVQLLRGSQLAKLNIPTLQYGHEQGAVRLLGEMTVENFKKDAEGHLSIFLRQLNEKAILFPKSGSEAE